MELQTIIVGGNQVEMVHDNNNFRSPPHSNVYNIFAASYLHPTYFVVMSLILWLYVGCAMGCAVGCAMGCTVGCAIWGVQ